MNIEVSYLEIAPGQSPYLEWEEDLDTTARNTARMRINRLRGGNFGDCKPIGDGAHELRIDFGPGYRIYFGKLKDTIVMILCAGEKKAQRRDIKQAKEYWELYKNSLNKEVTAWSKQRVIKNTF